MTRYKVTAMASIEFEINSIDEYSVNGDACNLIENTSIDLSCAEEI